MYISTVEFGTPEYDLSVALRDEILRKPLGLSFTAAQLQLEWNMVHLALFDQANQLSACLVLVRLNEDNIKMRQVAVANHKQGSGLGTHLVEFAENYAAHHGYTTMQLHARDQAISFYDRLGYDKEGDAFTEVGLKHYKMIKKLK